MGKNYYTPYHEVSPSPWPFCMSMSLFCTATGLICLFKTGKLIILFIGVIMVGCTFGLWCRDVVRESTFQGFHTRKVQCNIKFGFSLFVGSEASFFFAFFSSYIYYATSPGVEIGCQWPPFGVEIVNPYGIPLFNTVLLISSGITLTISHYALRGNKRYESLKWITLTIFFGLAFSCLQFYEYKICSFNMSSSVYGSIFFLITGFHGLHVIVGSIFLYTQYQRMVNYHFTPTHHIGFELALWYWHFVDVIWIIVFFLIYIW